LADRRPRRHCRPQDQPDRRIGAQVLRSQGGVTDQPNDPLKQLYRTVTLLN